MDVLVQLTARLEHLQKEFNAEEAELLLGWINQGGLESCNQVVMAELVPMAQASMYVRLNALSVMWRGMRGLGSIMMWPHVAREMDFVSGQILHDKLDKFAKTGSNVQEAIISLFQGVMSYPVGRGLSLDLDEEHKNLGTKTEKDQKAFARKIVHSGTDEMLRFGFLFTQKAISTVRCVLPQHFDITSAILGLVTFDENDLFLVKQIQPRRLGYYLATIYECLQHCPGSKTIETFWKLFEKKEFSDVTSLFVSEVDLAVVTKHLLPPLAKIVLEYDTVRIGAILTKRLFALK